MKIFKVTVEDVVYYIKDEDGKMSEEEAKEIAWDWYTQREMDIYCEELEASSFPAVDAYC